MFPIVPREHEMPRGQRGDAAGCTLCCEPPHNHVYRAVSQTVSEDTAFRRQT